MTTSGVNAQSTTATQSTAQSHPGTTTAFDLVFLEIFLLLSNKSSSLEELARKLGVSAEAISTLNDQLAAIKNREIPEGATSEQIDNINRENQNVNNHRSVLNNDITVATQNAKIDKSIFQTFLSGLEQDTSASGNLMKMENEIAKLINELSKRTS